MIRKVIIVVLILAAIANLAVWISTIVVEADRRGTVWRWGPCDGDDGPTTCVTTIAINGGLVVVCLPVRVPEFAIGVPWHFEARSRLQKTSKNGGIISVERWGIIVIWQTWLVALILFTYPTIVFIRGPLRRWRRCRKGLCMKCGYNLTGNTSGICPECGEGI